MQRSRKPKVNLQVAKSIGQHSAVGAYSARSYPWIVPKQLLVESGGCRIATALDQYGGRADGNQNAMNIDLSKVSTMEFQRAENSLTQIHQKAIKSRTFRDLAVGVDSSTPPLKAITDRVSSPEACQTLCKSTTSCAMFTFYIDGRSGANCVLKPEVLLNEVFLHPVAVTGSTSNVSSLALRGMKFGYEMKSSTIVTPPDSTNVAPTYTYDEMFRTTSTVDSMAKKACSLLGVEGYAVVDYVSLTAHAVPASDAEERLMPNFNYIHCSKVN
ncbi:hypothetical protein, conserved [Eimeria praecox]|uniref:Apple domain-containing protein n=1 Tax=Eimeria praecox TaxID=51316 RepID=U6H1N4_9EIME|nr:hypothetical protein, conserved [Eimeria praecox]